MATTGVCECDCLDEVQTPLNACSLEALPLRSALHVVVGCYQLEEASHAHAEQHDDQQTEPTTPSDEGITTCNRSNDSKGSAPENSSTKKSATRSGELRLYSLPAKSPSASPPQFGTPAQVVPMESGVLDAKWWRPSSSSSATQDRRYLASACASGRIHVHQLVDDDGEDGNNNGCRLEHVSSSSVREADEHSTRLALSLDWEKGGTCNDSNSLSFRRKIVSSYSDVSVSIHSFCSSQDGQSLVEEERWDAHTLFGCPSEVWTCCFAASASTGQSALSNDGTNLVMSGGDDCTLKLWDVRSCSGGGLWQPMAKVGNAEFEAGVTAVSYHPTQEHMFAVGSYDEVVRLYDVRNWKDPLGRVNVVGGVWRIRWHPNADGRMLVGAMHGGCRIVDAGDFENPQIVSKFTKHESMAYGADWLVGVEDGGGVDDDGGTAREYAASCSFYDRRVCLWRSKPAID